MEALKQLIDQARHEGKWLHCTYQDLWFRPDELAAENANGRFLWGPVNWTLRDPSEHIAKLQRDIKAKEDELARFRTRAALTIPDSPDVQS